MLEILPIGASKGAGVQMLVDHMEVPIEQVKRVESMSMSKNSVLLGSLIY
jgi:hypothetical protein